MKLASVFEGVRLASGVAPEVAASEIAGIDYDSRRIGKDFLFFAFPGAHADGREFARDALARGARAVVSELPPPANNFQGTWIPVEHGRRAMAIAARNFYHRPDERVSFTGITGTNGKTTTSYLTDSILRTAGFATALIGTIEHRLLGEPIHSANTTPESLDVMRIAADLEQRGDRAAPKALTMEVSSHALALGRVHGIRFHTAVFTNLTRDHLDFHRTMEDYGAAKRILFHPGFESGDPPAPEWAVLNRDDPASEAMAGAARNTLWYGLSGDAQIGADNISADFDGLHFEIRYEGARQPAESALTARFNVMNILAAAGVGLSYGLDLDAIAHGIAACRAVPGRFERVQAGQPFLVVVDYAHTDDALRNAIQAARALARSPKARVITLFGCGGDRDRT
ncbi:MAG: Mur ligase family protein, partial [Bryobacteraceae bacterium]